MHNAVGIHSSQNRQLPTRRSFAIIRWVDNNFNKLDVPIELIDIPNTDSETLTIFLVDCLIRDQLTAVGRHIMVLLA